jgi:uncharacterized protein (DUF2384 family)
VAKARKLMESASDRDGSSPASPTTLQDIIEHTRRVFDGREALAREWLCSPNPALCNDVPLIRAATEQGAQDVEAILTRIEHGVFS